MNQKETIAYLAGIIDGEGFLEIRKSTTSVGNICYSARMIFFMMDKSPSELFVEVFGGRILITKMKGTDYYGIAIGGNKLEKILIELLPYLRVKKEEARCLLELVRNRKKFPPHPVFKKGKFRGTQRVSKKIQKERKKLFKLCKLAQNKNKNKNLEKFSKRD